MKMDGALPAGGRGAAGGARGGEGAAREFCELILRAQGSLEAAHAAYL